MRSEINNFDHTNDTNSIKNALQNIVSLIQLNVDNKSNIHK